MELTMSSPGAILREIHRLRRNAKDLQTRIAQGPRQLQTQKDKAARQEEILRQAQDQIKQLKVQSHEKEVLLKSTDEKIKKFEKQLNDIMSKKEYDALRKELAHARNEVSKLEDQIIEFLGKIEEKTAAVLELEKNLKEARSQAKQFEGDYQERMAGYAQQNEEVLKKLAEVEAGLPADIKPQYDRLTELKGEDALAAVDNRTCAACYTEVTPQNNNDLFRGQFVLCKSCGRMLYLPE